MSDIAAERAYYANVSVREWVEGLEKLLEGESHSPEDDVVYVDPWEYMLETTLEGYAVVHYDGDTRDTRAFVMVLGTGGPHYEVEISATGAVEGRCYWGTGQSVCRHNQLKNYVDGVTFLADYYRAPL